MRAKRVKEPAQDGVPLRPYAPAAGSAARVAQRAREPSLASELGPEPGNDRAAETGATQARLATSERLLDTAAKLFWTKGYASTTTREIAEVLGVRKASLYHHISSKEDLLFAISVSSLEHICSRVKAAVEAVDDPVDRVRTLVHAHVASMIVDQDKHSVMLTELRALSPDRRARIVEMRDAYEQLVTTTLEHAKIGGALRDDVPVKFLALSLLNLLNWSIFWFQRNGGLSPDRLATYLATIYLCGACKAAEGMDLEANAFVLPKDLTDERNHTR